ncbi:MAG: hypothetical protein EBZ62_00040 [Sphingobacteriia bacterium]|nr:hypothetical protein [Sphingobacteriia bacterium]
MKTKNFITTVDGKEISLTVCSPSLDNQREATKAYNQAFTEALKSKAVVRARLDDILTEQGLWDGFKQAKFNQLQSEILESERKLAKGGIPLSEAKQVALSMKQQREEIRSLISVRTSLDTHTAEGQADNARFNYLVYACTVYTDNNKRTFFNSLEDYLNRSSEPAAIAAAQNLANMLYGLDNDYESSLPENKFLKQYKFVDSKLRLINKDGKLVDEEGRLIDENNRFIDKDGNFVDKFGNKVDKDGEYIVDTKPFLDDQGQPIVVEETKDETKTNTTTPESTTVASTEKTA